MSEGDLDLRNRFEGNSDLRAFTRVTRVSERYERRGPNSRTLDCSLRTIAGESAFALGAQPAVVRWRVKSAIENDRGSPVSYAPKKCVGSNRVDAFPLSRRRRPPFVN